MTWYLIVLQKYAVFTGRATRREYWMFTLFNILFAILAAVLDNVLGLAHPMLGYGPIYGIYALGTLIPGLAVAVRRLHDIGKSGWWLLIGLVPLIGGIWLLVLMATDSIDDEQTEDGINDRWENADTLDAPMTGSSPINHQSDNLIMAAGLWMAFSMLFWRIMPIMVDEYYTQSWFTGVNLLFSLVWAALPFALAFAVRDQKKKTILIVIASVYALVQLYGAIEQFL